MDAVYWVCLLVGGFFVLLSVFGGGDTEADADVDADFDADVEADFDAEMDADLDADGGTDFVDLLSIRALFLFAAFFGLTGVLLGLTGTAEVMRLTLAVLTGLVVGLGGNWLIKRVGYAHVSSDVTPAELKGRTATVLLPFEGVQPGKILLDVKGHRLQLRARAFGGDEAAEPFQPGEEVVVVRMDGSIAEVVKPT